MRPTPDPFRDSASGRKAIAEAHAAIAKMEHDARERRNQRMSAAARTILLRRIADWMRSRRLDAQGKALLAEAETLTADNRGRPPSAITPAEARRLIREHGSAEAAARAIGTVSGETIRRKAKTGTAATR